VGVGNDPYSCPAPSCPGSPGKSNEKGAETWVYWWNARSARPETAQRLINVVSAATAKAANLVKNPGFVRNAVLPWRSFRGGHGGLNTMTMTSGCAERGSAPTRRRQSKGTGK